MEKNFKRVLCLMLSLCVIFATAMCLTSIYPLAEELSNETSSDSSDETSSDTSSNTSSNASSNTIVKDESKRKMLKQENYKIRYDGDEPKKLNHQNFQYNFPKGNGVIKAETTYIFSFEYYCEVGEYGTGAYASCFYARTNTSTSLGAAPKDMIYNEELGTRSVVYTEHIGRHKAEVEFTTLKNQTSFAVGLMSGVDGVVYYWNFKLVEKDGDGTNLIEHGNFYGEWQDYVDAKIFKAWANLSPTSADGLGSYSFIPFSERIANLPYEKTLEELEEEENVSSEETSSEEVSSDISSNTSSGNTTSNSNTVSNVSSDNTQSNTSSNLTTSDEVSSGEETSQEISSDTSSEETQSKETENSKTSKDKNSNAKTIIKIIVLIVALLAAAAITVTIIFIIKKKQ